MNDYLLALVLGIVEGLTEFLPVSSTAHLRLTQAFFGIDLADGFWKMFAIMIQFGAILCVPLYFRHRIAAFVATFPRGAKGDRTAFNHPLTLTLLAFVSTAVPAFLLRKIIGKNLESLSVMALSMIVGGVVMTAIDMLSRTRVHTDDIENITSLQAVWIGLCQSLAAIFPGTSRSMATISAGEASGLSRATALEFSFLISIPTMAVATAFDFLKSIGDTSASSGLLYLNDRALLTLGIGFVSSFVVAYAVVGWFMNWVKDRGFVPFAVYRILAGIAVLGWAMR